MEKKNKNTFEKNISRLQEISELLESENLALEEAIKLYEEGILLSKTCTDELKKAELKISQIKSEVSNMHESKEVDLGLIGEDV